MIEISTNKFVLLDLASSSTFVFQSPTHHFVDVLLYQLHSPGLCDHPPGLLRVEPHTLSHIVPEGEGEIVKYSGTINKEPSEKRDTGNNKDSASVPT